MPEIRALDQPDAPTETMMPQGEAQPGVAMMSAEEYRYQALVDPEALRKFNAAVTQHLDQVRRYSKDGRNKRDFDSRHERRRDRAQVKVQIEFKDDGSVEKVKDAHAKLGINQGWTHQANVTARKEIFFKLFRSAPRFYVIQGWGRKEENEKLEAILEKVAEHLLRRGGFYSNIAPTLCQMLPVDGTVCLRFNYVFPHSMALQPSGAFRESLKGEQPIPGQENRALFDRYKALMPQFEIWNLEDVLVTDWDREAVHQQEGVFLITPQTTVNRLARQEAVYVWEGEETEIGLEFIRRVEGRFVNMRQLRESQAKNLSNPIQSRATQYQVDGSRTSSFSLLSLVEYEGQLPMSRWVMDGTLTPELAQYFEIDVGYVPDGSMASLAEWGRRLDSINYYEVAYTVAGDTDFGLSNSAVGAEKYVLRLCPCPYRAERAILHKFHYLPDRNEFLGLSICDLGWRLENLGDLIMNATGWTQIYNSNPSGTVFKDFLEDQSIGALEKLMALGNVAAVTRQGVAVSDMLKLHRLDPDPRAEEFRASIKFEFENTTGIPPITKGAVQDTATGTATELQMSAQRSEGQLDMVAYDNSIVLALMVKEMLTLAVEILGPEEFKALAVQACGKIAADIDHVMNEIMNGEFDVVSALANTEDPAVIATMIQRLYQLTVATGQWNDREFIKFCARHLRIPDIEKALAHGEAPMSPASEHEQMGEGNTVKVHPEDDDLVHIQEHRNMQIATTPDMFGGMEALKYFTPEQVMEIQKQLPSHMMQHQMAYQQKLMMGQGQGQPGGGQQGQAKQPRMDSPGEAGTSNGGGNGGGPALEMDTNPASGPGLAQRTMG